MGCEIERKYLVRGNFWRGAGDSVYFRQGYLSTDKQRVVRVLTPSFQLSPQPRECSGVFCRAGKITELVRIGYQIVEFILRRTPRAIVGGTHVVRRACQCGLEPAGRTPS